MPLRHTVLVVDPDDRARAAVADLLRECGYHALTAAGGREGLAAARLHAPELVIVEVWPACSGAAAMVERLRADVPPVPVLVLTSHGAPETRAWARELGCAEPLEKPCPAERLVARAGEELTGTRRPRLRRRPSPRPELLR